VVKGLTKQVASWRIALKEPETGNEDKAEVLGCTRLNVWMCECACVRVSMYMSVYIFVCTCLYVRVSMYMFVCMCLYVLAIKTVIGLFEFLYQNLRLVRRK
jgi:hypothetical protein